MRIFLFESALFMSAICLASSDRCVLSKPCTCGFIDLSEVRYPLQSTEGSYTYYMDPCGQPLTEKPCMQKNKTLAVCQVSTVGSDVQGLGSTLDYTATGNPDNGTVVFTYSYTDSTQQKRISHLAVICAEEEKFSFEGEKPKLTYRFTLGTPYACKDVSDNGGLSGGSVLLIIFFVLLAVYLIGGILFLKFVRKAEGLEAIPNYEFWKDFPLLVKDGIRFTCRGCKAESTYEKI